MILSFNGYSDDQIEMAISYHLISFELFVVFTFLYKLRCEIATGFDKILCIKNNKISK